LENDTLNKEYYSTIERIDKMKKTTFLILIHIICISLTVIPIRAFIVEDEWDKAEKGLLELMPKMPSLSDKFPNDLEIQLGIAALYFEYGVPKDLSLKSVDELNLDQKQKFFSQCEKVFLIDPNNKPGLALYSRRLCREFTSKRTNEIEHLDGMIENARGRDSKEVEIFPNSTLKKYFSEKDQCVSGKRPYGRTKGKPEYALLITDFDLAVRQLHEMIDKDVPSVLEGINNAQNRDPDNAYYNYLKAHLFFSLGEKNKALKEIEEAVAKKYFSSFPEELAKAKDKVLSEAGLAKNYRDFVFDIRRPFEDFVNWSIWRIGLSDLGKEYETRGEIESAEKIYRLTIEIAKQVQKESIYKPLGLDRTAQKRINELSNKIPEK